MGSIDEDTEHQQHVFRGLRELAAACRVALQKADSRISAGELEAARSTEVRRRRRPPRCETAVGPEAEARPGQGVLGGNGHQLRSAVRDLSKLRGVLRHSA